MIIGISKRQEKQYVQKQGVKGQFQENFAQNIPLKSGFLANKS